MQVCLERKGLVRKYGKKEAKRRESFLWNELVTRIENTTSKDNGEYDYLSSRLTSLEINEKPIASCIKNHQTSPISGLEREILSHLDLFEENEIIPFEKWFSSLGSSDVDKLSESTYSEIFIHTKNNKIFKVIPIREDSRHHKAETPVTSSFVNVLHEIMIAKQLSPHEEEWNGFGKFYSSVVVKGKYPRKLIEKWKVYHTKHKSENASPDMFDENQFYCILVSKYCGTDMESTDIVDTSIAFSVILQVSLSLVLSQKKYQFEHRDLHLGNILMEETEQEEVCMANPFCNTNNDGYQDQQHTIGIKTCGVLCTIIDYSISRINIYSDGKIEKTIYADLNNEEGLFLGDDKVDEQYGVYRKMKDSMKSQYNSDNIWAGYNPITNKLWVEHLVKKLSKMKSYRKNKTTKHNIGILSKMLRELKSSSSLEEWVETNLQILSSHYS